VADIQAAYAAKYNTPIVRYVADAQEEGFLSAGALSGLDRMEVSVTGNADRILLTARYDNLGKGASGAAVECLNLVLGVDPTTGLEL
jgi:N-acetyl-gamma-glutamyl-phosphate reductase